MANLRARRSFLALLLAVPALAAADPVSPSKVLATSEGALGVQPVRHRSPRDQADVGEDRSLAPFLYVPGEGAEVDRVPLKETSADVTISGVIAKVKVRQVFANEGKKTIEAIYVFPGSTRAAVHGMRMKIGQRVIEATIDRKQAARETYEAAKAEGKRTSLLEQERPNVFTMSVANIGPKETVEVELDYSELLVPEDAVYEFIYPTVVGPRYTGGADPGKDQWMANPHLPAGNPEPYKFGIAAHIEGGIPLKDVASPSHGIKVDYPSPTSADIKLTEAGGGNRDFVLRYRLSGEQIESGLLLYPEGQDGGYFALMMEPPRAPKRNQIPAREYIFLLDVSGSMHGFPLDTAKVLMGELLGQLRPTDQFNVALFSGANFVMSPSGSLPATPANIEGALGLIQRQRGGGGTELIGGLEASYAIPRRSKNLSRTIVVVTDGYVGVEAQAFRLIREHLDEANLFAFGIGSSVNRWLIEGMSRAGMGEPFVVLGPPKAKAQAQRLRAIIEAPVMTEIELAFDGFEVSEMQPAPRKIPDLMARRPIVVFGKYRGAPKGTITLTGRSGGERAIKQTLAVATASTGARNAPLATLWARKWVGTLEDQVALGGGKDVEEAITQLGLEHKLLTAYTSFVAVDHQGGKQQGKAETVRQPLPMPQGVPDSAVGHGSGTGSGYGVGRGRSYAPPAPSSPSPAPPPAESMSRRPDKSMKKPADAPTLRPLAEEDESSPPAAKPRLVITNLGEPTNLGDTRALVKAIERKFSGACAAGGEVKLRLRIDASGKLVKVDILGGDRALGQCLSRALTGLVSATKAQGADAGTFEVTIRGI